MIALALFLALVCVIFFVPLPWISWVRATAGAVLGRVLGKARASAPKTETAVSGDSAAIASEGNSNHVVEVRPERTNKTTLAAAAKNVAGAVGKVIAWIARNPWLALIVCVVVAYLLAFGFNGPFDWGKSKDVLRLEREIAESRAEFESLRADLNAYAAKRGDKTQAEERRVSVVVSRGQEEITNAVAQNDFEALYRAYADSFGGVWNDPGGESPHENPAPRGSDGVPAPRGSPV